MTPLAEAGPRTEPPVSVPSAKLENPAATAAPLPPLDPAGDRSTANGLRICPPSVDSAAPLANSLMLVNPRMTHPARLSRRVCSASWIATESRKPWKPAVAGHPATSMFALRSTGIPCSALLGPLASTLGVQGASVLQRRGTEPKNGVQRRAGRVVGRDPGQVQPSQPLGR